MCLSFPIMVLFSAAMPRHSEQIFQREINPSFALYFRTIAWVLLAFTFYLSGTLFGWSIGPAVFFGALTIAVLLLILLLTYREKIIMPLALVLPVLSGIFLV
jgi:hypothetical protein